MTLQAALAHARLQLLRLQAQQLQALQLQAQQGEHQTCERCTRKCPFVLGRPWQRAASHNSPVPLPHPAPPQYILDVWMERRQYDKSSGLL